MLIGACSPRPQGHTPRPARRAWPSIKAPQA